MVGETHETITTVHRCRPRRRGAGTVASVALTQARAWASAATARIGRAGLVAVGPAARSA